MSQSVCKFVTDQKVLGNIEPLRFVHETEVSKFKQPMMDIVHRFNIVMSGHAVFEADGNEFPLEKGSIFITCPCEYYHLKNCVNFTFTYITFTGEGVDALLNFAGIDASNRYFSGFDFLCDYFNSTIRFVNSKNGQLLTQSALLYALAFIVGGQDKAELQGNENLYNSMVDYINHHYCNPNISLNSICEIFSYSPKYVSALFNRNMNMGFSEYVNKLRTERACLLMDNGQGKISDIASQCGFKDPMYFSKVFKKLTGISPKEYVKNSKMQD